MANKIIVNKQGSLNWRDMFKGAIMAVGVPVLTVLQELIPGYDIPVIYKAGLSALITYLLKNVLAKPTVVTTYDTNAKAENVAEEIKS